MRRGGGYFARWRCSVLARLARVRRVSERHSEWRGWRGGAEEEKEEETAVDPVAVWREEAEGGHAVAQVAAPAIPPADAKFRPVLDLPAGVVVAVVAVVAGNGAVETRSVQQCKSYTYYYY